MSSFLQFGRRPGWLRMFLVPGQPYETNIKLVEAGDAFWGVSPSFVFANGQEFPAGLVSDQQADWYIPADTVDDLLTALGDEREVTLKYGSYVWAKGRIEVI